MLPELDKLRDKTLSFWCILKYTTWPNQHIQHRIVDSNALLTYDKDKWLFEHEYEYKYIPTTEYKIIWHPLTRWRIEHCYRNNYPDRDVHKYTTIYAKIYKWFEHNRETAYNQSEIERQTHEKRPELKELLIQFSNYL